jgi:hypothetical protein
MFKNERSRKFNYKGRKRTTKEKDYLERDNEQIVEWNSRARKSAQVVTK